MSAESLLPATPRRWAVALGIFAFSVAAVAVLGGPHLGSPGAYHDEIYQAPAAFTWIGRPPWHFCLFPVRGIPLFTMPYSGALKPALFGIFMKVTGVEWSLTWWRLYGLLLLGSGVGVLATAAWRRLGAAPAAVLALLCATDLRLLEGSRIYDGVSIALGFLLRACLLGTWLRWGAGSVWPAVLLGFFAGLAAYDKLHEIVLVPGVGILLIAAGRRGLIRRALAAAAGFMIGALPVIWVHLAVWMDSGEIFALQGREAAFGPVAGVRGWGSYYRTLATLAVPDAIQRIPLPRLVPLAEGVCFTAALAVCALIAAYRRAASLAGLLVGWLAIAASFLTLPAQARPNHLLAATPLIYAAVAVALEKTRAAPTDATWIRPLRRSLFATVALWLVVRCFAMATAEGAYWGGATTRTGNPNFTRFARHAATRDERATFLVGQWGIGNSLYCESQGKPGRVIEASIWSSEDLAAWMRGRDGPLFLVGFEPGWFTETHPQTDRILATLRAQADWIESRALEGLNGFRPLVVWRFDRR